jgi:Phage integrase family
MTAASTRPLASGSGSARWSCHPGAASAQVAEVLLLCTCTGCPPATARQVEDLAAAIDPRYGLLVRFAAYTGLRAGELVALRVRHLNLLRGRCEVGESATEVDGRLVWGPTKTYARRTVPLPRFLCEQLAVYLAARPHGLDDLVFTAPQGGPLREQKFVAGISSRRRPRRDSPTGCGSMTFAIPARACSSPRGRASRRSRPGSGMPRRR